jgi:hypothetical protein
MALPGWQPLIVCDPAPAADAIGAARDCDWEALITLVRVLINNMVILSTLMAVIVFCYAGFILLTSGGKPGALDRAKGMFWKVIVGYVWILAAWLIVYTITSTLLGPGFTLLQ